MKALLAKLTKDTCPSCREPLATSRDALGWTKTCPHGHYREENYGVLGARIVSKSEG